MFSASPITKKPEMRMGNLFFCLLFQGILYRVRATQTVLCILKFRTKLFDVASAYFSKQTPLDQFQVLADKSLEYLWCLIAPLLLVISLPLSTSSSPHSPLEECNSKGVVELLPIEQSDCLCTMVCCVFGRRGFAWKKHPPSWKWWWALLHKGIS